MALDRLLFDISKDSLLVLNKDYQIKKANRSMELFAGCLPGGLVNTSFLDLIHKDDQILAKSFLKKMYDEEEEKEKNEQLLRFAARNTTSFIKVTILLSDKSEVLISVEDTSARKQNETGDFINDQVLHLILDLLPYPVFVKNNRSEYILLNQAQADLFDHSVADMLGKTDAHFVKKKEELDLVLKSDKEVLESDQKVVLSEQYFTTPNGKNYILQTIKVPFFNAVTSEKNILGVSIDYTERKLAQDELMKTNFELDNFVYRASHDLKAPLRSVMGLVNLMKLDDSKENRDICLERIENSIQKMNGFIKDLTNYSRNARLEIQNQTLDLENTFYEILESLKYLDTARKVNIRIKIKSSHLFASDKLRLEVILQNILSNSIKYQNPQSLNPLIEISGEVNKKEAVVLIKDNGIGIKKEYQDGVFRMFYRATELSEGSGLGLYIVKQAIEKLDGHISFNSEENMGTIFKLQLKNLYSS